MQDSVGLDDSLGLGMRPDWTRAPEWAGWAAQELSGTTYFHELKPKYQPLTGEWVSKGRTQIIPRVDRAAQDTLEERPRGPCILHMTPEEAELIRKLSEPGALWGQMTVIPE